ncbi:MAG: MFS transporter [Methanomicrobiales archaeon]|nr:MFS transporter [Methanomicrobiales archaeon]
MPRRLPLHLGIFAVMALSNAIVPILPSYGEGPFLQSAIYAAYFLGAFATVIPAGALSDRIGRVPVVRAGLLLTLLSGILILAFPSSYSVLAARALEGVAAGLFVAAAMALVNSQPDHEALSGIFMGALNAGLVVGLLATGSIDRALGTETGGILLFTILSAIPLVLTVILAEDTTLRRPEASFPQLLGDYKWLFLSAVILVGMTGALTAIYPGYRGGEPVDLATALALMNLATIGAVVVASRLHLPPVPTIRAASLAMVAGVLAVLASPLAFLFVGAVAGVVMIAQMAYLGSTGLRQGRVMGLYNASSYLGMTMLPALAGILAEYVSFIAAFLAVAALNLVVAATIGRCECRLPAAQTH